MLEISFFRRDGPEEERFIIDVVLILVRSARESRTVRPHHWKSKPSIRTEKAIGSVEWRHV
eukprot:CAMPEP_0174885142 /NCGR_PEP_ID=MMETSP0167-20121228/505_1 /TAXON_ID=38298 /ORGANISM="Rhodella maculata, Strain CCMP736" /LENGTH=60 /DNA_ID=CAMNT_0016120655 /DNA_START=372 /DNA_END=554 /DNA_ORIENTATION=-